MTSSIYNGAVIHKRFKPKKHFFKYNVFSLLIDLSELEDLDNAVNDAKDLEKVLREKYGFETTLLTDKKSGDTLDAIINFTKNRDKQDNILIFYAGHGQLEKKQKRGYWLPTDAGTTQDSKWISNLNIKDFNKHLISKFMIKIMAKKRPLNEIV